MAMKMGEMSPLRTFRLQRGLTIKRFAQVLGVSYAYLNACEVGSYKGIPKTWRHAIETLGADYDVLNAAQQAWRCRQGASAQVGGEAIVTRAVTVAVVMPNSASKRAH